VLFNPSSEDSRSPSSLLREDGPSLLVTDGPVLPFHGFSYPTRMAVMRWTSGGLLIWSPIPLTAVLQAEIDALGPVCHLVAPNKLLHLWLNDWKMAYPDARA
jgi:hypothetical protein